MAVPTYVTGQALAASDCNTWFVPVSAVKPSDQSVTSSTVLVNDTALVIPVQANRSYEVEVFMVWTGVASNATPGLKYDFTLPAAATFSNFAEMGYAAGAFAFNIASAGTPTSYASGAATSPNIARGLLVVGVNAGNFQLQVAQGISSATSTTMKAGSFIVARAIA
jgi:hypothetical protein